jgi:hypothetical protein
LEAKQAISFFVYLINLNALDVPFPQPFAVENHQTREKFVITKATTEDCLNKRYSLWIWRYPFGANSEWIEEMANYQDHNEHRNIAIDFWAYLGICI